MRTAVPVSNVFSLSSHGHQKRQAFGRNKQRQGTWQRNCMDMIIMPPAEFFVTGCLFWLRLSVSKTPLRSGGDANGHKKCFYIFDSLAQHRRSIHGILCCRAWSLVSGSAQPPPHDAAREPGPQCVPRSSQMQHMWKRVSAQIHKSPEQKRSAALGKRVADI